MPPVSAPIYSDTGQGTKAPSVSFTYDIVTTTAYLIGVDDRFFEQEWGPLKLSLYERLQKEKEARIIRNLCLIRTQILRHFKQIDELIYYELNNLNTLPQYVSQSAIKQLRDDGLDIIKVNTRPDRYLELINEIIVQNVDACKGQFPIWFNWNYIRQLIVMPQGTKRDTIAQEMKKYQAKKLLYPYQTYISWNPCECGNILYNDKKFIIWLYGLHQAELPDLSYVEDAPVQTKSGIYAFVAQSARTVIVVDCENCDPHKLYAMLRNLDKKDLLKIRKIILYDDQHTTSAWSILNRFVDIPIEHIVIERVTEYKSLVDISMTAGTCKEFYQNNIDSFILASSDSDFWGLISALPDARFLVLVEYNKCGTAIQEKLTEHNIFYCFIDDFCRGNSGEIKTETLLEDLQATLKQMVNFNAKALLTAASTHTRTFLTPGETREFYNRYIKSMRLNIDQNGNVSIMLGS